MDSLPSWIDKQYIQQLLNELSESSALSMPITHTTMPNCTIGLDKNSDDRVAHLHSLLTNITLRAGIFEQLNNATQTSTSNTETSEVSTMHSPLNTIAADSEESAMAESDTFENEHTPETQISLSPPHNGVSLPNALSLLHQELNEKEVSSALLILDANGGVLAEFGFDLETQRIALDLTKARHRAKDLGNESSGIIRMEYRQKKLTLTHCDSEFGDFSIGCLGTNEVNDTTVHAIASVVKNLIER